MGTKTIYQISNEESTALSDTDLFEGQETSGGVGGNSFKVAFSIVKSTLKTYFDALYVALVSSTDNRVTRFNGAGGQVQSSGVTLDDSDNLVGNQGTLYNFKGSINAQTGTTYTTQASDNGKIITLNNASAITLTVHSSAPAGFNCLIIQKGAGQVTVAAGGTGNVRNADGHTKLKGQYAMGSIFVESNAGTAPEVYFGGNTAA